MVNATGQLAQEYIDRLRVARTKLAGLPKEGARELPFVRGVAPDFSVDGNVENKLHEIGDVLVDSKRIFRYHDSTVIECDNGDGELLRTLIIAGETQRSAVGLLANVFALETLRPSGETRQFAPTRRIVDVVLAHEPTAQRLPRIRYYGKRPLFDSSWKFCGRGFHAQDGLLIHCEDFALKRPQPPSTNPSLPVLQRLPPHLRTMFGTFCFAAAADAANAIAMFVTAIIVNHFVSEGHPLMLIDGNQPSIGKTHLARTLGIVIDGREPRVMNYHANEDELAKQVCAHVRDYRQSLLLFDNAKSSRGAPLSNSWLEAHCTAAELSLRVLGTSSTFNCDNSYLWIVTMNQTAAEQDILSRSLPIRLRYTGDADQRDFAGFSPLQYAFEHRQEILHELFGMVNHWLEAGRPLGNHRHRLAKWASTLGGIMNVNGIPEFLANWSEVTQTFDPKRDQLTSLAEASMHSQFGCVYRTDSATVAALNASLAKVARPPAQWRDLFLHCQLLVAELERTQSKTAAGKRIGDFLGGLVGRTVEVTAEGGGTWSVTLKRRAGRSNSQLYYFEIEAKKPAPLRPIARIPPSPLSPKGRPARTGNPRNTEVW